MGAGVEVVSSHHDRSLGQKVELELELNNEQKSANGSTVVVDALNSDAMVWVGASSCPGSTLSGSSSGSCIVLGATASVLVADGG